jgi:phosphoserine phosphatase
MVALEIKGPLVIDLDGTFIKCTSFNREIKDVLSRRGLLYLLRSVFREGAFSRSKLKLLIADLSGDISYLRCVRGEIRQLIDCQLSAGGEVMIASAAAPRSVQTVLKAAGLSSLPVLASSSEKNMKGSRKAKAILLKYGGAEFTYIGDSVADLPVFNAASAAYLVCPKLSVAVAALLNPRAQVIQLFLKNEKCAHDN